MRQAGGINIHLLLVADRLLDLSDLLVSYRLLFYICLLSNNVFLFESSVHSTQHKLGFSQGYQQTMANANTEFQFVNSTLSCPTVPQDLAV